MSKVYFRSKYFKGLIIVLTIIGLVVISGIYYLHSDPRGYVMPVKNAKRTSYNQKSFWAYPWGSSGHHKGVDIFAKKGTPVVSATRGIVIFKGVLSKGGNALLVFGPNLKLHYYAHLDKFEVEKFALVNAGDVIGTVGNTGNAKGKPYHLHYSIRRVLLKLNDSEISNKSFYDDPVVYLNKTFN